MGEKPVYPFKPGDWVVGSNEAVAKVKSVYGHETGEVLLDLIIYAHNGDKVGRESPACGGPRCFEPACVGANWRRIPAPRFPLVPCWVDEDGRATLRMWAGERLPPANWSPPKRRGAVRLSPDDELRRALKAIADGHNDPRALAKSVLGLNGSAALASPAQQEKQEVSPSQSQRCGVAPSELTDHQSQHSDGGR